MTSNFANDGRAFESSLERVHAEYERRHIATVSKVEPPAPAEKDAAGKKKEEPAPNWRRFLP